MKLILLMKKHKESNMFEVTQLRRADLGLKFRVCDNQSWALLRHFAIFQGYDFHGHSRGQKQ